MVSSDIETPLAGFMATKRPERPTRSLSWKEVRIPACFKTKGSPARCWVHNLCPDAPSKAITVRSAIRTKTRPPATKGDVKEDAGNLTRQMTLAFEMAINSLACEMTAKRSPSPPMPAATGVFKA